VPRWLAEPTVALAFPMRGEGDADPPAVNPEYTPLTNALPHLEKLAAGLGTSLIPIVFNWERAGPWCQPDAYPPLGGAAPFREFMARARARGWRPALYGDGMNWCVGTDARNTGYDGMAYFRAHGGEAAVVRNWGGRILGGVGWRRNYVACAATEAGRRMVLGMTRGMTELGAEVLQHFDQRAAARACYATDHGHPPVPGPWMTAVFDTLLREHAAVARSINPAVVFSCEGGPPEAYLQDFQIWDARAKTCPLYAFLYHEYANGFSGLYTNRVNDEALRLSVARALVTGYILNFALRDQGRIAYDWDYPWGRAVPDQAALVDWAGRATRFRTGIARDYLVHGRMLRPWTVRGVAERDFGWGKEPAVPSATWRAPDGRIGVVLANSADLPARPHLELEGEGTRTVTVHLDGRRTERALDLPAILDLEMDSRALCLVEVR